jgi:phosphate transport system substrate-binding protein
VRGLARRVRRRRGDATRDSVKVVGSSTVYPFAKLVAENFSRSHPDLGSPIIESTGTGGGINLFCGGVGADHPDIANASRRMKASEFATCQQNGVTEITEIQVGLDGLAFASAQGGIKMNLTPRSSTGARRRSRTARSRPRRPGTTSIRRCPNLPILVYGPPSTSGTRDALKELVLIPAARPTPR